MSQNSAQQQGLDYEEMMKKAAEMQAQDPQEAIPRVVSADDAPLPAGWASAQDAQGRTYYCELNACWAEDVAQLKPCVCLSGTH
jgi:hypothetical protein